MARIMPQTIRMLIVDPARAAHEQLARPLNAAPGFEIAGSAYGGQEALDLVPSMRPAIALIDLDLPDIEGIRTAALLTARYPWVSVIIIAGEASAEQLRRAMLAGARHFLVKPVADEELAASVRSVYELARGASAASCMGSSARR